MTSNDAPAFPPVLIKLDEDLAQCESWATPDEAVRFLEECGADFKPEHLNRFLLDSVNGDRAKYVPDSSTLDADWWDPVVLQWNGGPEWCTQVDEEA